MTPHHVAAFLVAGLLIGGIALAALGIVRVVRLVKALQVRLDTYQDLAVLAYLDRTQVRVTRAMRRLDTASTLVYRARAALTDIENARARLQTILTSPSSLLDLATVLVTRA